MIRRMIRSLIVSFALWIAGGAVLTIWWIAYRLRSRWVAGLAGVLTVGLAWLATAAVGLT